MVEDPPGSAIGHQTPLGREQSARMDAFGVGQAPICSTHIEANLNNQMLLHDESCCKHAKIVRTTEDDDKGARGSRAHEAPPQLCLDEQLHRSSATHVLVVSMHIIVFRRKQPHPSPVLPCASQVYSDSAPPTYPLPSDRGKDSC